MQLTLDQKFGLRRMLSNFNTVGALVFNCHLVYYEFMTAAVHQDLHSIRGNQLLPAFIPSSAAAR